MMDSVTGATTTRTTPRCSWTRPWRTRWCTGSRCWPERADQLAPQGPEVVLRRDQRRTPVISFQVNLTW